MENSLSLIEHVNALFSRSFENFLDAQWRDGDSRLHCAIKYCLSGEGKRIRAALSMLVCASYDKNPRLALSSATAVEMIHAYSLAHDDLPCMDNDDMRRGRPSLHRAFDECTALLAGDAILTDAMRLLVDDDFFPDSSLVRVSDRVRLVRELALASGSSGMVYGQDKDIFWTARSEFSLSDVEVIHKAKTGALMGAASAMGAISAGATDEVVRIWREIGVLLGLAFQAIDDALDTSDATGKTPNKDEQQKKLTYMALFERDKVIQIAKTHSVEAIQLIPGNVRKDELINFIGTLLSRQR